MLDHSAYFILTQCPDGVFEAIPIEGWYNFTPDINYQTLTADEVELEFSRRTKTLSNFASKYNLKGEIEEDLGKKVTQKAGEGLVSFPYFKLHLFIYSLIYIKSKTTTPFIKEFFSLIFAYKMLLMETFQKIEKA